MDRNYKKIKNKLSFLFMIFYFRINFDSELKSQKVSNSVTCRKGASEQDKHY